MRLFTAIDLPQETLLRLDRLLAALRPEALLKWSPLDNLHITTKFIGECLPSRVDEIHEALLDVVPRAPFEVEVQGLGWFPNKHSPRVLWAGVKDAGALQMLAKATNERLASLGIPREEKEFAPHLTLARIKNPVPLNGLRERLEELQSAAIGKFQVSQFTLFRSDPGSNSSIYRKLREYRFEASLAASNAAR